MNPIHPALAPLARAAKEMPGEDIAPDLRLALTNQDWLRPEHRVGDPTGYMRHVLYVDPEGAFVITAITWLPGQASPVHGHQVWCAYAIETSTARRSIACRTARAAPSSRCTSTASRQGG